MIAVNCDNITLSFGTDVILDGISFSINEGDRLGIVGVNGAGKSSLFKIISGEYTSDTGGVYIAKGKTWGILDQYIGFDSDKNILDEMLNSFPELLEAEKRLEELQAKIEAGDSSLSSQYAAAHDAFTRDGGYEFRGRCKGILKNLGFDEQFWDLKISSLSGGQKTRLALVRLLLTEPDILMLDEPTNHLDMNALYWLESYLKTYRKTVMVISHDRYFLDSVTNKTLEIENTHGKLYNGNYTRYIELKTADREIQEKHYRNQQKEIARIEAYIEQQRRWNRERNIIAAESRQKQLDKMVRVEKPSALPESIRLRFSKSGESGNDVLTARGLSMSYPGKPLFKNLDVLIKKHEHVFITGDNGCGKSTLIKIIAGKMQPESGVLELGYNVTLGYYDQENQELNDDNTVIDELWNEYDTLTQTEIRNALALFLFKGDDIEKKVAVLSGGERARLTLTQLILSKMNLLILDEPTNHLDINSREALEKALLDFDGTIIAVSHDRYFINKLATRILDFGAEKPYELYDYHGGFEEYREYKAKYLAPPKEQVEEEITASKEQYLKNKKSASDLRKLETKIKRTQDEIMKLEEETVKIDEEASTGAATNHVRLSELYNRRAEIDDRLLELYELLEETENQLEEFKSKM
nr:ABC-F family ATP-binding cassette domain-containing protein [Clostridia bacterium]